MKKNEFKNFLLQIVDDWYLYARADAFHNAINSIQLSNQIKDIEDEYEENQAIIEKYFEEN
jgi:hypothetical protein